MAFRSLGRATLVCGIALLAFPAQSFVPRAHRVIDAVADANVAGRRVGTLRFSLELHIGDGPTVATGELVTHPTGMARLELRAHGGLVERHILQGNQHSASRNSRMLVRPRAFLPPLFVLQSSSSAVLEAALKRSLGVESRWIGLAPCGDADCYVLGDPTRDVRQMPQTREAEIATLEAGVSNEPHSLEVVPEPISEPEHHATLWVDTTDYVVRRVELSNGVTIVLGPYVSFEKVQVPKWWSIQEPGKRIVRFEVEGVVVVNAPPAAFDRAWLMAPVAPNPELPDEGIPPDP